MTQTVSFVQNCRFVDEQESEIIEAESKLFGIIFAENCMKMKKKIGLSGTHVPRNSAFRVVNTNTVT